jgi:chemotaxis protein methyltransferase CheR
MDRRNSLAHAIVATVREPLIVLDRNLRVVGASRSFYRIFRKEPADTVGRPFLTTGERDELRRLLEDVISGAKVIEAYEIELDLPRVGRAACCSTPAWFDQKVSIRCCSLRWKT